MKNKLVFVKSITFCLIIIFCTNQIGYAKNLSDPYFQANCGIWNAESSIDQRIQAKSYFQISKDDCSELFEISNETGFFSLFGGYSLDLTVTTNNADKKFKYDDPWLIPGAENEVRAIPININNPAWINIQGDYTSRAIIWDIGIHLIEFAVDQLPLPYTCVVPEDKLIQTAFRVASTSSLEPLFYSAGLALDNGDINEAKKQYTIIVPKFFESLIDLGADTVEDCFVDWAAESLKKVTGLVLVEFVAEFVVWGMNLFYDKMRFGGFQTSVRLIYTPSIYQPYIPTNTTSPPTLLTNTPPTTIISPVTPIGSSNSSTAMLFDVSSSMNELDKKGITKLDAAKESGALILDIIEAENNVAQDAEVGILSFSDSAWVNSRPSIDVDSARSALFSLSPIDGTGMPDGLRLAIDQFPGTQTSNPIIIMLSDGLPNIPLASSGYFGDPVLARQQSLDLASEAGRKGICIYTVGFGIPNATGGISGEASIDEDFLTQVAANAGCGAYYNAQNATELVKVYVYLRHKSTGNILLNQTGNISQDQTVDIGNAQVPDNQSMILFTLNWPGSRLDAVLTDPSGQTVDTNYPKAYFSISDTLASIIIQDPQTGEWKVEAKGIDVPEGTTDYNAILSVRPNPNPPTSVPQETPQTTIPPAPGFPIVILLLVVAGGGIAIYVYTSTRSKRRSKTPVGVLTAQLIGISGEKAGQTTPIRDRLIIGRGSGCTMRLSDRTVSRQHAILRFANDNWYLQDMNSRTGTFVNDGKVDATTLNNGDRIRIGSSVFEFRSMR